nr:MAG TPA: putative zinc-ribbon domain protein [Caudoviricetes sp.]
MPKPLKDYTSRCGSCSHFFLKIRAGHCNARLQSAKTLTLLSL